MRVLILIITFLLKTSMTFENLIDNNAEILYYNLIENLRSDPYLLSKIYLKKIININKKNI